MPHKDPQNELLAYGRTPGFHRLKHLLPADSTPPTDGQLEELFHLGFVYRADSHYFELLLQIAKTTRVSLSTNFRAELFSGDTSDPQAQTVLSYSMRHVLRNAMNEHGKFLKFDSACSKLPLENILIQTHYHEAFGTESHPLRHVYEQAKFFLVTGTHSRGSLDINWNAALKNAYTNNNLQLFKAILHRANETSIVPNALASWLNVSPLKINDPLEAPGSPDNGKTYLQLMCDKGQIEFAEALLTTPGLNLRRFSNGGSSAIHWAIQAGKYDPDARILSAVIKYPDADALLNRATDAGITPLHFAARQGYTNAVRLLLATGQCRVNEQMNDPGHSTPIELAAKYNHHDAVQLLAESPHIYVEHAAKYLSEFSSDKLDPNPSVALAYINEMLPKLRHPRKDLNALLVALAHERHDITLAFLTNMLSIERVESSNLHPQMEKDSFMSFDILLEKLKEEGIHITPDSLPSLQQMYEGVYKSLPKSSFSNACAKLVNSKVNGEQITDAQYAIQVQKAKKDIQWYLEQKHPDMPLDVNKVNANGKSPLHWACQAGDAQVVRALLENGAHVRLAGDNRYAPVFHWLRNKTPLENSNCELDTESREIALLLLQQYEPSELAKVSVDMGETYTPLAVACTYGLTEIIETAIKHGVALNGKNYENNTPLHFACKAGKLVAAELLINAKKPRKLGDDNDSIQFATDLLPKDAAGKTPLQHAWDAGHVDIILLFLAQPAVRLNLQDGDIQKGTRYPTPETALACLNLSYKNGHDAFIRFLLSDTQTQVDWKAFLESIANDKTAEGVDGFITKFRQWVRQFKREDIFKEIDRPSLKAACSRGDQKSIEAIQWYLTQESTVFTPDLLDIAAQNGHLQVIQLIYPMLKDQVINNPASGLPPFIEEAAHAHNSIINWWLEINPDSIKSLLIFSLQATTKPGSTSISVALPLFKQLRVSLFQEGELLKDFLTRTGLEKVFNSLSPYIKKELRTAYQEVDNEMRKDTDSDDNASVDRLAPSSPKPLASRLDLDTSDSMVTSGNRERRPTPSIDFKSTSKPVSIFGDPEKATLFGITPSESRKEGKASLFGDDDFDAEDLFATKPPVKQVAPIVQANSKSEVEPAPKADTSSSNLVDGGEIDKPSPLIAPKITDAELDDLFSEDLVKKPKPKVSTEPVKKFVSAGTPAPLNGNNKSHSQTTAAVVITPGENKTASITGNGITFVVNEEYVSTIVHMFDHNVALQASTEVAPLATKPAAASQPPEVSDPEPKPETSGSKSTVPVAVPPVATKPAAASQPPEVSDPKPKPATSGSKPTEPVVAAAVAKPVASLQLPAVSDPEPKPETSGSKPTVAVAVPPLATKPAAASQPPVVSDPESKPKTRGSKPTVPEAVPPVATKPAAASQPPAVSDPEPKPATSGIKPTVPAENDAEISEGSSTAQASVATAPIPSADISDKKTPSTTSSNDEKFMQLLQNNWAAGKLQKPFKNTAQTKKAFLLTIREIVKLRTAKQDYAKQQKVAEALLEQFLSDAVIKAWIKNDPFSRSMRNDANNERFLEELVFDIDGIEKTDKENIKQIFYKKLLLRFDKNAQPFIDDIKRGKITQNVSQNPPSTSLIAESLDLPNGKQGDNNSESSPAVSVSQQSPQSTPLLSAANGRPHTWYVNDELTATQKGLIEACKKHIPSQDIQDPRLVKSLEVIDVVIDRKIYEADPFASQVNVTNKDFLKKASILKLFKLLTAKLHRQVRLHLEKPVLQATLQQLKALLAKEEKTLKLINYSWYEAMCRNLDIVESSISQYKDNFDPDYARTYLNKLSSILVMVEQEVDSVLYIAAFVPTGKRSNNDDHQFVLTSEHWGSSQPSAVEAVAHYKIALLTYEFNKICSALRGRVDVNEADIFKISKILAGNARFIDGDIKPIKTETTKKGEFVKESISYTSRLKYMENYIASVQPKSTSFIGRMLMNVYYFIRGTTSPITFRSNCQNMFQQVLQMRMKDELTPDLSNEKIDLRFRMYEHNQRGLEPPKSLYTKVFG